MANIYFQLGKIKGECKEKNHKDWINVETYQFEISHEGWVPKDRRRESNEVQFGNLILRKGPDKSSTELLTTLLLPEASRADLKAALDVVGTNGDPICSFTFEDVVICSVESLNEGRKTVEKLEVGYGIVRWDYKDESGKAHKAGYDRNEKKRI